MFCRFRQKLFDQGIIMNKMNIFNIVTDCFKVIVLSIMWNIIKNFIVKKCKKSIFIVFIYFVLTVWLVSDNIITVRLF